jgi:hypothetical protein
MNNKLTIIYFYAFNRFLAKNIISDHFIMKHEAINITKEICLTSTLNKIEHYDIKLYHSESINYKEFEHEQLPTIINHNNVLPF